MNSEDLAVETVDYNPKYLLIFEDYKKRIKTAVPGVEPELIGSAAVHMKRKKAVFVRKLFQN